MFAGKTAINKAINSQALICLVTTGNRNNANNTSQIPLTYTSVNRLGSQAGIIFIYMRVL
jgi:hypothetical protein